MDVVLIKAVPALGQAGETKRVAVGYGKNYLLPCGLAVLPTDPRAKQILAQLRANAAIKQREQATIASKVGEWAGKTITLTGKASADGTLYAAITSRDVAGQLGVDAKRVQFEPVKTAGTSQATLDLGSGGRATVVVEVRAQS